MKFLSIIFLFLSLSCFAQKRHLTKFNHGYSFNISSSWVEVDKPTLQKKIAEDIKATGKKLNYDYVFSSKSSRISHPFIIVSPLYAGSNMFETIKKSYVSQFDKTIIKYSDLLSEKLDEINFNEKSLIIDNVQQSIISTVTVTSEGVQITNLTFLCFNNQYAIQFVFSSRTEYFPLFLPKFKEIIKSVKTFKVTK